MWHMVQRPMLHSLTVKTFHVFFFFLTYISSLCSCDYGTKHIQNFPSKKYFVYIYIIFNFFFSLFKNVCLTCLRCSTTDLHQAQKLRSQTTVNTPECKSNSSTSPYSHKTSSKSPKNGIKQTTTPKKEKQKKKKKQASSSCFCHSVCILKKSCHIAHVRNERYVFFS